MFHRFYPAIVMHTSWLNVQYLLGLSFYLGPVIPGDWSLCGPNNLSETYRNDVLYY